MPVLDQRQAGAERFAPLVDDILDTVEAVCTYAHDGSMRDLLAAKIAAFVSVHETFEVADDRDELTAVAE